MRGWPGGGRDRAAGHTGHASGARKYSVRIIRARLTDYGLLVGGHLLNAARKPPRVIKLFSTRCCATTAEYCRVTWHCQMRPGPNGTSRKQAQVSFSAAL